MEIHEMELKIKELEKELKLLHISDAHLSFVDERDPAHLIKHGNERWEAFQKQGENPLFESFTNLIDYAKKESHDCTIMTGDIIDFPSGKNLDMLSDVLNVDNFPYLYTVGNHDYCCYTYETETLETKQRHQHKFDAALQNDITFAVKQLEGVLLISIDNSLYQFTDEQERQLLECSERGMPMLLFFHIPLFTRTLLDAALPIWRMPILCGCPDEYLDMSKTYHDHLKPTDTTMRVCRWIADNDKQIKGVFAGHLHFNHEDNLSDNLKQYVVAGGYYGKATEIRCVP